MRHARMLAAVAAVPMVGLALVAAGPTAAGASSPGPVQIPITSFGLSSPGPTQCPAGTFVVINPGPQQSPTFVLINPGPQQCPQGVDVLINPGPINMPQGEAVALPLTAADCQAGTALLTAELAFVGGGPGGGVPGTAGAGAASTAGAVCPSGDASLAALHAALAGVATLPAGQRTFVLRDPGPINVAAINPGPTQAPPLSLLYGQTRVGREVIVAFLEGNPDTPILVGSANETPGISILKVPCQAPCA